MTMEPPTADGPLASGPNPWRSVPRDDPGGASGAVEQPEPTRMLPQEPWPDADAPTRPGRYAYPSAAGYVYPPDPRSVEPPVAGRYAYPASLPGPSDAVAAAQQPYPYGQPVYPQFEQRGYYQAPAGAAGPPPGWGGQPPGTWGASPPPPLSGQPPSLQPTTKTRGWLLVLGVLVGVTVFGLMTAVAVPRFVDLSAAGGKVQPTPARPTPRISPSASASPSASPSASASASASATATPSSGTRATMPASAGDRLKKNPIYTLKVPAKCPSQNKPGSEAAFRKQVKALVDCQNKAWAKALATISGVTFAKPTVKFYSSSTKSPCGRLGTTYPASYCSGNRTLYFSKASYLQGRYYRTSVAHFVIHEYAHHVQELALIFDSMYAMDESSAVSTRRIELQAHCMAHYGLTHSSIEYNAFDRQDAEYQFDYTTDAKGHGSTKAERYWGVRGLDAGTIGACNTWKVKASKVK